MSASQTKPKLEPISLSLSMGSKHEAEGGSVDLVGSCVVLRDRDLKLVMAYCMKPGETLTRKGSEYIVEF